MSIPANLTAFLKGLPIPWLFGGPNGQADAGAQGGVYDGQVSLLKEATKARLPSYGPADALDHIGGDRQLIQGTLESDANFRVRCKNAWAQHEIRGTWVELLTQMFWSCDVQPGGAYIIQQNGRIFSLTTTPLSDDTSALACTRVLVNSVSNDGTSLYPNSVPFYLLGNDAAVCTNFLIVFPTPWLGPFRTVVVVTFDGTTDRVRCNWPSDISGDYTILPGLPQVSDGYGSVTLSGDETTRTPSGIDLIASSAFTGSVVVVAVPSGANPFLNILPSQLSILRTVVKRWKPSKANCKGMSLLSSPLNVWGWPIGRKWNSGGKWGDVSEPAVHLELEGA